MNHKFSKQELDEVYNGLSVEQKEVLDHHVKRGKKTSWLNVCAKQKGFVLTPEELENPALAQKSLIDWELIDYIDHRQVSKDHCCECGRPLRYEYVVVHYPTGIVHRFGKNHLEQHLGLEAKLVVAITKELEVIDLERDEILTKVKSGYEAPKIPDNLEVPKDMVEQLRVGLPLLRRQDIRLNHLIQEIKRALWQEQIKSSLQPINHQPKEVKKVAPVLNHDDVDLSGVEVSHLVFKLQTHHINVQEVIQLICFVKYHESKLRLRRITYPNLHQYTLRLLGKTKSGELRSVLSDLKDVVEEKLG